MAAWFGKARPVGDADEQGAVDAADEDENPDEVSTGRIAKQVVAGAGGGQEEVDDRPQPSSAGEQAAVLTSDDTTPQATESEQLRAHRSALIELCLYAIDRARSGGVVERLEHGLADVGVHPIRPDGQRFDPSVHEAGGTVGTADTTLDGVVAETEVVGYADGETVLRVPIVTVYAHRGEAGA